MIDLPLLTAEMPGSGGAVRELEDFVVEEIPAYLPTGEGEHCMAQVQKRGLTTPQAIRQICETLGLDARAVGYAGMKDKDGVTTQWLSFMGTTPAELLALTHPRLQVLQAAQHKNKLRTGHLRGNHFTVVLRDTAQDALARARAVLEQLQRHGLPNYYGPQRFGRRGDNAQIGLSILRGERKRPRDRRMARLLFSAVQSMLFNHVVARRLREGMLGRMLGGEVLQRTQSGGLFVSEDLATDAARLEAGELLITGPIFGPRMPWPAADSPAAALEQQALDQHQVTLELLAKAGRQARGGRRPITVPVEGATLEPAPEAHGLRLQFALPAGSYATVLLAEVTKGSGERGAGKTELATQ